VLTAGRAARTVAGDARPRRIPGEAGIWVLIFGDMVVFAVLFATQLYYRADAPEVFAQSQGTLNQNFGVANTVVLLTSSLFVATAVSAMRAGNRGRAGKLIAAAMTCGLIFSGLKIAEYSAKLSHDLTPSTNDFYMYYFVLTGLHWLHLIIGMVVLTVLFVLARKPKLSGGQSAFFESGACFWHMVDLLWIVLFPLLYLVR
jgi:nitric oxide reductase NorE protein